MSWQGPGGASPSHQYSPDGRWYWDGTRWLPVPAGAQPPSAAAPPSQPVGIGSASWAPGRPDLSAPPEG
ncbi:MAG: hypothetical protein J2P38_05840, partial [Candidatus Dormibacteraeota bacterium]|nr:hypothetical protein [Candidatus Dormibacteraeota bacterium]